MSFCLKGKLPETLWCQEHIKHIRVCEEVCLGFLSPDSDIKTSFVLWKVNLADRYMFSTCKATARNRGEKFAVLSNLSSNKKTSSSPLASTDRMNGERLPSGKLKTPKCEEYPALLNRCSNSSSLGLTLPARCPAANSSRSAPNTSRPAAPPGQKEGPDPSWKRCWWGILLTRGNYTLRSGNKLQPTVLGNSPPRNRASFVQSCWNREVEECWWVLSKSSLEESKGVT